jgi:hypothetical protein
MFQCEVRQAVMDKLVLDLVVGNDPIHQINY